MSDYRLNALSNIKTGLAQKSHVENGSKISEIFGENVFSLQAMMEYLAEGTYYKMVSVIKQNTKIDVETAENVAKGMKKWAMDNGATHYSHWFQPLTGKTAEKHDAFYKPSLGGAVNGIESLSAAELVQREPDASSFPNGGLRSTSLARGYTIWDPSSPAFILETENGKTLCVPAIFISYTKESLDYKTPLLKSSELINIAATEVCHYFDKNVNNVIATLGWEQEYFLVDENLYNARPDLILTGRTLFGCNSAKHQQMEDHYFGSIPERVQKYMVDFEKESLRLGIPISTRHNEVAPGQYECAPIFEELNVAVDHNLLLMDVMNRVAQKHGLRVLFHEKPFAGVNGSGKHNNWSLATDKGKNLLSPGVNPSSNLYFLTFFINIIKAIDTYSDVLRASIASTANDHRLGANEAPPAIISIFTGSRLQEVVEKFKNSGLEIAEPDEKEIVDLKIPKIPEYKIDNTDRNRTSPFPFTGNKFEFRAVGSSANCSASMTTLNTIVAKQLIEFKKSVDILIEKGLSSKDAIVEVLKSYLKESERIIFNGDGYSKEWEKEASKRGLSNQKSTPEALSAFLSDEAKKLFIETGIFNEEEIYARYNIQIEKYIKEIEIEANVYSELVHTHILPPAYNTLKKYIDIQQGLINIGIEKGADNVKKDIESLYSDIEELKNAVNLMQQQKDKALAKKDHSEQAKYLADKVKPIFDTIRNVCDKLELLIDDNEWKFPKYRELLYLK
jgi:glutamine synthetase